MLCSRSLNPGQVGSELTGFLCQCAGLSTEEARYVRWWHFSRPLCHPLPGMTDWPLLRLLLRAPVLPRKTAPPGGSLGLGALSSLGAGQSFTSSHT